MLWEDEQSTAIKVSVRDADISEVFSIGRGDIQTSLSQLATALDEAVSWCRRNLAPGVSEAGSPALSSAGDGDTVYSQGMGE